MALKLEPVSDSGFELFEISIVIEHSNLVNQQQRIRRYILIAYILIVYPIATV